MGRHHRGNTERAHRAVDETEPVGSTETPKQGEVYRCTECGMEMKVTTDCACDDPQMVRLECCGQDMTRL